MNWIHFTYIFANLITNSIHGWLTKDYIGGQVWSKYNIWHIALLPYLANYSLYPVMHVGLCLALFILYGESRVICTLIMLKLSWPSITINFGKLLLLKNVYLIYANWHLYCLLNYGLILTSKVKSYFFYLILFNIFFICFTTHKRWFSLQQSYLTLMGVSLTKRKHNKNNHKLYTIILYWIIVNKIWMYKVKFWVLREIWRLNLCCGIKMIISKHSHWDICKLTFY